MRNRPLSNDRFDKFIKRQIALALRRAQKGIWTWYGDDGSENTGSKEEYYQAISIKGAYVSHHGQGKKLIITRFEPDSYGDPGQFSEVDPNKLIRLAEKEFARLDSDADAFRTRLSGWVEPPLAEWERTKLFDLEHQMRGISTKLSRLRVLLEKNKLLPEAQLDEFFQLGHYAIEWTKTKSDWIRMIYDKFVRPRAVSDASPFLFELLPDAVRYHWKRWRFPFAWTIQDAINLSYQFTAPGKDHP